MNASTAKPAVPWHYWIIALVSLLWNAFGGYDYVMTRMHNMAYLDSATGGKGAALIAWLDSTGVLVQVGWPLGVWASVLGSVLLLLRSRHAAMAFLVSLAGAALSMGVERVNGIPPELDSGAIKVMNLVILAAIVVQWWYARRAADKGYLA